MWGIQQLLHFSFGEFFSEGRQYFFIVFIFIFQIKVNIRSNGSMANETGKLNSYE
jgi:hypothetical protein